MIALTELDGSGTKGVPVSSSIRTTWSRGELKSYGVDDEKLLFSDFLRNCGSTRFQTVAIHKAIVMGPVPIEPYFPFEVGAAARAFPDINFEIVHGGWAFNGRDYIASPVASQLITVSTEGTTALLAKSPRKFLEIIGTLMLNGATDRILWAIGGLVRSFSLVRGGVLEHRDAGRPRRRLRLPASDRGSEAQDPRTHAARMLGIDVEQFRQQTREDGILGKPRQLAEPYSTLKPTMAA